MSERSAEMAAAVLREIRADIDYYTPAWEDVIETKHLDRWRTRLDEAALLIYAISPDTTPELAALRALYAVAERYWHGLHDQFDELQTACQAVRAARGEEGVGVHNP